MKVEINDCLIEALRACLGIDYKRILGYKVPEDEETLTEVINALAYQYFEEKSESYKERGITPCRLDECLQAYKKGCKNV